MKIPKSILIEKACSGAKGHTLLTLQPDQSTEGRRLVLVDSAGTVWAYSPEEEAYDNKDQREIDRPQMTALMQAYNHSAALPQLVEALKKAESHLSFLASAMPGELAAAALCKEVAEQARAALAQYSAKLKG